MATTFKTLGSGDVVTTRSLLHEAIPITGSIVSGTYSEANDAVNVKDYSHGMFQSVYDYPYLSSSANHIFDEFGKKQSMDKLLNGSDKDIWWKAIGNEFGRLAKGIGNRVISTDTIDFICKNDVPQGRKVTYGNFICDYKPLKSEPYRVRLTVGGDRLEYESDAGSPAASLVETKLTLNSTISDAHRGARFMSADLKDFFLATTMKEPEYMRIHYKYFPQEIKDQYNLANKVTEDGYIYVKIKKECMD